MRVEFSTFWCPKSENRAVGEKGGGLLIFFLFSSYRMFCLRFLVFVCMLPSKFAKNTAPAIKKGDPGTQRTQSTAVTLSQRQLHSASGASQSGVRPASWNHPSSRAGDQDDVSYKQTPSNKKEYSRGGPGTYPTNTKNVVSGDSRPGP